MITKSIPKHLLLQIQQGTGRSFRNAIKFETNDFKRYIPLEYNIVRYILKQMGCRHLRFLEQTLVITRRNQIFDVIDVEVNHDGVLKYYFDISETFGLST